MKSRVSLDYKLVKGIDHDRSVTTMKTVKCRSKRPIPPSDHIDVAQSVHTYRHPTVHMACSTGAGHGDLLPRNRLPVPPPMSINTSAASRLASSYIRYALQLISPCIFPLSLQIKRQATISISESSTDTTKPLKTAVKRHVRVRCHSDSGVNRAPVTPSALRYLYTDRSNPRALCSR